LGRVSLDLFRAPGSGEEFKWSTRNPRDLRDDFFESAALGGSCHYYLAGFGIAEYGSANIPEHALTTIQPLWFLTLVTGILPLLWAYRRWRNMRRRKLLAAHRCPVCGYDLRASPTRCPECGTSIAI